MDLDLIPIDYDSPQFGWAHSLLKLECGPDLFHKIKKLPTSRVPEAFNTHQGTSKDGETICYGNTQETPDGNPLMAVTMAQLKTVGISGPVGAFVAASPDDQRVALYWY